VSDRALFDKLADLAADLLPGRTLIMQGSRNTLREPGYSNGSPGWWLEGGNGGFITFANMIAYGAYVDMPALSREEQDERHRALCFRADQERARLAGLARESRR